MEVAEAAVAFMKAIMVNQNDKKEEETVPTKSITDRVTRADDKLKKTITKIEKIERKCQVCYSLKGNLKKSIEEVKALKEKLREAERKLWLIERQKIDDAQNRRRDSNRGRPIIRQTYRK